MAVDKNYRSVVAKPDDFHEFWNGVVSDADSISLDPTVEKDDLRSTGEIDVYQVFYNSLDNVRVSGWYAVPKGASGKLPAMIALPGYLSDPPIPKDWAAKGYTEAQDGLQNLAENALFSSGNKAAQFMMSELLFEKDEACQPKVEMSGFLQSRDVRLCPI